MSAGPEEGRAGPTIAPATIDPAHDPHATFRSPDEDQTEVTWGGEDEPPNGTSAPDARVASGYALLRELGRGGMGVVWLAQQKSLRREVAVKQVIDAGNVVARSRFIAEAMVTATLDHPNIVPVYELGANPDGTPFLAMKVVRGASWRWILHPETAEQHAIAAQYDLPRHIGVLVSVCNAVAFAHSRGIVHRDLKPENVMIGNFGEVAVMDWGLAVDVRDERPPDDSRTISRTAITAPSGTPAYMPPEMAEGRGKDIDARSDVYLVGAILYEILVGHAPHRGDSVMNVLIAAAKSEPPEFPDGVPDTLCAICTRAMSRLPADRYPTMTALRDALEGWLGHRESLVLSDLGEASLSLCLDNPSYADDVLYRRFADAIAEFRQAGALWADNPVAADGERRARRALAEAALARGDLGLAASEASHLADDHALAARVAAARTAKEAQRNVVLVLRAGLVLATLAVVGGLAVSTWIVRGEQARTAEALDDVLRLSDVQRLDHLVAEARDASTNPARPAKAAAIEAWLARARALVARTDTHQATLEALRARAAPYDPADAERDRVTHPDWPEHQDLVAERAEKVRRGLDDDVARIDARLGELEAAVGQRRTWAMPDAEAQWEHDTVATLVQGLERLVGDDPADVTIAGMQARLAFANTVQKATIDDHRAEWDAAIAGIAASPLYGGLVLTPQVGLVPLGKNPVTGLYEFVDVATGVVPGRAPDGHIAATPEMGIVFVLLPGGTFTMGATPDLDPDALDDEAPVTAVTLAPFFLAAHEMTQGQWLRATGSNPAQYGPGSEEDGEHEVTLQNALENVSWDEATAALSRLDLVLPTEAQWEYGMRGGTTTPYWTGPDLRSIAGAMNVADVYGRDHGGIATNAYEVWLDDGHRVEAPVGSYRPNAFGLYDMGGNVLEWCRDNYGSYENQPAPGDGLRVGDAEGTKVHRGGNWFNTGPSGRSAIRDADSPDSKWDSLGFRAARAL